MALGNFALKPQFNEPLPARCWVQKSRHKSIILFLAVWGVFAFKGWAQRWDSCPVVVFDVSGEKWKAGWFLLCWWQQLSRKAALLELSLSDSSCDTHSLSGCHWKCNHKRKKTPSNQKHFLAIFHVLTIKFWGSNITPLKKIKFLFEIKFSNIYRAGKTNRTCVTFTVPSNIKSALTSKDHWQKGRDVCIPSPGFPWFFWHSDLFPQPHQWPLNWKQL